MKKITLSILFTYICLLQNIVAQHLLPYTFENNSRYLDEDIYIGLVGEMDPIGHVWMDITDSSIVAMSSDYNTVDGPEWSHPTEWKYPDIFTKLSDIENKTIQIPHGLFACRIFISFESPMYLRFHADGGYAGANLNSDSDPNDGIRWEIIELTWGDAGLWTNTSRVDAYQYPMGLEVNGYSGGVTGETYEDSYINAVTNGNGTPQFKKIGELLSHDEILAAWDERVSEDYLVAKTRSIAKIYGIPTTVNAIEGSGDLAYTPYEASENQEAYDEDLMIQAQIAAAISRHAIYTDITDETIQYSHDASRFFQIEPYNEYVSFFHNDEISFESQTYAFAYDDVGDHSSTIQTTFPTDVKVIIGGYGEKNISPITDDSQNDTTINLYPNPSNNNDVLVSGLNSDATITIFNIQGQLINTKTTNTASTNIEASQFASGVYLISVDTENENKTFKLIVNY